MGMAANLCDTILARPLPRSYVSWSKPATLDGDDDDDNNDDDDNDDDDDQVKRDEVPATRRFSTIVQEQAIESAG